jgi:hypothetical protein
VRLEFTPEDIEDLIRNEVERLQQGSGFAFATAGEFIWSDGRSQITVYLERPKGVRPADRKPPPPVHRFTLSEEVGDAP